MCWWMKPSLPRAALPLMLRGAMRSQRANPPGKRSSAMVFEGATEYRDITNRGLPRNNH